ncbi:hypothetical protein F5H01DRAFT_275376 [Linnemannia elongata]|nr:hypothetical protein F5H01DRAFT_275376 [Linnemannia elongata]
MTDISTGAGLKVPTARKRLASPSSPQSTPGRETSTPVEHSMTPSPRLPPRTSGSPGASSSPRSRKNSIGGSKREHKVGVTATSCANCGTTTTPLWRRAGNGQTICNACGLYFKARNLTRPTWLKRNTGAKKAESGAPSTTPEIADEGPGSDKSAHAATTTTAAGAAPGMPGHHLVCANCRTTTTPLWRRDSSGNTICNACGLYFKLHNVHRPVTMKRAVIKRRKRVNLLANSPPLAATNDNEDGSAHLPPISMPSSNTQHQPLPRASEILHQRQESSGPHHSHHYSSYSQQQQPPRHSSPPPPPTSSAAAPSGGLPNTEVLQQTREDLQREVSHLSMLLGRAAAVLNGLDQALGPNNASGGAGGGADAKANPLAAIAALGALPTDLKTSSALASLMALSASGGDERGAPGSGGNAGSVSATAGSGGSSGGVSGPPPSSSSNGSGPSSRDTYGHTNASIPPPPPLSNRHTHMSYPLPRRE